MKQLIFVLAAAALLTACRCGDPQADYSDGYRVGRVEKISHKGLVWKSWEGYLVLAGFNVDDKGNATRETFEFSVLDKNAATVVPVLERAQEHSGMVKLHYQQDWMDQLHYSSSYFVDSAVELKQ
jgi:hypothetical protein